MRMMNNKRANIPVTVLVVLTIALCISSLIIFHVNNGKVKTDMRDYNFLEEMYSLADDQVFLGEDVNIAPVEGKVSRGFWRERVIAYHANYVL